VKESLIWALEHLEPPAYGALGRSAARLLPLLKGMAFEPTEHWDMDGDILCFFGNGRIDE
jgi:hypothetical protein